MSAVKKYSGEIGIVFIILAVAIVGILIYKGFSKRKSKK